MGMARKIVILAGPNGAGKTTLAREPRVPKPTASASSGPPSRARKRTRSPWWACRQVRRGRAIAASSDLPACEDFGPAQPLSAQIEPDLRRGAEEAGQSPRRIGGDAAPAVQDGCDASVRHVQRLRQGARRQAEFRKFLGQDFAGMDRRHAVLYVHAAKYSPPTRRDGGGGSL